MSCVDGNRLCEIVKLTVVCNTIAGRDSTPARPVPGVVRDGVPLVIVGARHSPLPLYAASTRAQPDNDHTRRPTSYQ